MCILAVVFAAMTPLLYALMFSGIGMEDTSAITSLLSVSGKTQFFASFSISNNLGLIAPVLLAIVLCKDFSFGTVRNKIISGKSRISVYLSLFITCATVLITVMVIHAFLTLGISLIFFEYQSTPFTLSDFWYFIESLAFEILVLLWITALLSYLCTCMKNVGLVIVLYIAVSLVLVIAGSIVQVVLSVLEATDTNETLTNILSFIDRINVGTAVTYIGTGTKYAIKDVLYLTISPIVGILFFTGMGIWQFSNKDLK